MPKRASTLLAWCAASLLACNAIDVNAQSIAFVGASVDQVNYSPSGLNIGNAGFWFAQFNATAPITNAAVDDNDANSLPAWVLPNFGAGGTFAATAFSEGGDTTWDMLTLPDGVPGLSGAVVDSNTANNSNNTIARLDLGPGTPAEFLMHVVVDNTNGEHDPVTRLRARGERTGVFDLSGPNNPQVAANYNSTADVYTFRYTGFAPGDFIKLQLNSGAANEAASIAGIMFDVVVPEPSSMVILAIGGLGLAGVKRRNQRRA